MMCGPPQVKTYLQNPLLYKFEMSLSLFRASQSLQSPTALQILVHISRGQYKENCGKDSSLRTPPITVRYSIFAVACIGIEGF